MLTTHHSRIVLIPDSRVCKLLAQSAIMKTVNIRPIAQNISHRAVLSTSSSASIRSFQSTIGSHSIAVFDASNRRIACCTPQTRDLVGRRDFHQDACRFPFSHGKERQIRRRNASQSSDTGNELKQTALHGLHVANGAKMVPFGGYSMPVQYTDLGVGQSHNWTREKASLFDVGHM